MSKEGTPTETEPSPQQLIDEKLLQNHIEKTILTVIGGPVPPLQAALAEDHAMESLKKFISDPSTNAIVVTKCLKNDIAENTENVEITYNISTEIRFYSSKFSKFVIKFPLSPE
ncbi:Cytoplasmic dynein 1 heavy chain 1 [Cichlidogyrus casuarinus]|uniref:Cytoplasmic dynein 1 heavy chain 1 n=1 Tax=Cichlidogyrus casuarinus TaxID=1844966 RepID=A0ABD2QP64_9PLAT